MEALAWLQSMLGHEFIRDAFVAGTGVALASGVAGYFLVLRGQVFAVDALSHVAFTGALAALAVGVSELVGLLAATILVAVVLSLLATEARARDVVTGSLFAWVLGLGVLFLSIYVTTRSTGNGAAGVHVLFGSVFGIGPPQTVLAVVVGIAVALAILLLARPLLFATIEAGAAAADGVPVRALGTAFLVLVAVITAEAVQVVGALLILGLIATPAAIAQRLTARPYRAMVTSAVVAILAVWVGLGLSYAVPVVPPSFAVIGLLFGTYVALVAAPRLRRLRPEMHA
jgi:zinc/manganese transport system permease protein